MPREELQMQIADIGDSGIMRIVRQRLNSRSADGYTIDYRVRGRVD